MITSNNLFLIFLNKYLYLIDHYIINNKLYNLRWNIYFLHAAVWTSIFFINIISLLYVILWIMGSDNVLHASCTYVNIFINIISLLCINPQIMGSNNLLPIYIYIFIFHKNSTKVCTLYSFTFVLRAIYTI